MENEGVQKVFGKFCPEECEKEEIITVGEQAILAICKAPLTFKSLNE